MITLLWTIAPKTKGNNEAISKDVLISKAFALSKYWVPGAKNRQCFYRGRYRKRKRTVLFWHPRNPITEAPNRSEHWIPLTRPQVVMEPQRPGWESAPTTCFQSQAFFSFIIIINIITFLFTVVLQVTHLSWSPWRPNLDWEQLNRILILLALFKVAKGVGVPITHHADFFSSYHASRKNKISTTLKSILLSFDVRKSEVEEREERAISWCHNYLFLMLELLVSNDIIHHGNFKGKITRHALRN